MTAEFPQNPPPGPVILQRNCWIESPDGEVSPLTLSFTRPIKQDDGSYVGTMRMVCKHFERVERIFGSDELQVMVWLLTIGRISLENREGDGYSIWHQQKGDLQFFDFWSGSEFEQEFNLPSAILGAKRARFYAANAGKFLLPGHRVGIEPDRPAITIYRIDEDGSDRLGSVIGPDEIKGHTWESLAQLVGERILWDSMEGIEMMGRWSPIGGTVRKIERGRGRLNAALDQCPLRPFVRMPAKALAGTGLTLSRERERTRCPATSSRERTRPPRLLRPEPE